MKKFCSCLLLTLATPGLAQTPGFVGYWAENANWCQNAGEMGEEMPDLYEEEAIFGLEWSCEITSATPLFVGQSWAVKASCLDAGYAYQQSSILMITANDRLLVIDEFGKTTDMVRCAKKPD